MENSILAYKLNHQEIEIIKNIGKRINKNIIIKNTDVPQDIVAVPSFMCFVNINDDTKENKELVLRLVEDMKDYTTCIIIDENTFKDEGKLQFDMKLNYKKNLIDGIKGQVLYNSNLVDFIDFDNNKTKPISYKSFEKSFLNLFIDYNNIEPIKVEQLIKLCNILADVIFIGKYDENIGSTRIELRIIKGTDDKITDEHLIAYRVSKEEILINWLPYIKQIIKIYLENTETSVDENNLFIYEFDERLWENIKDFVKWFVSLPLWKNRNSEFVSKVFAGKSFNSRWKEIFETGKTEDGIQVFDKPINVVEILKK